MCRLFPKRWQLQKSTWQGTNLPMANSRVGDSRGLAVSFSDHSCEVATKSSLVLCFCLWILMVVESCLGLEQSAPMFTTKHAELNPVAVMYRNWAL